MGRIRLIIFYREKGYKAQKQILRMGGVTYVEIKDPDLGELSRISTNPKKDIGASYSA